MRHLALSSLLLLWASAYSFGQNSPLYTFGELSETLKRGYSVKGTLYLQKCDKYVNDVKTESSPDIIFGLTSSSFEQYGRNATGNGKAYVTFKEQETVENSQGNGFVNRFLKVQIFEDGEVKIIVTYTHSVTNILQKKESYTTMLFSGTNKATAGAYFFVSS